MISLIKLKHPFSIVFHVTPDDYSFSYKKINQMKLVLNEKGFSAFIKKTELKMLPNLLIGIIIWE